MPGTYCLGETVWKNHPRREPGVEILLKVSPPSRQPVILMFFGVAIAPVDLFSPSRELNGRVSSRPLTGL